MHEAKPTIAMPSSRPKYFACCLSMMLYMLSMNVYRASLLTLFQSILSCLEKSLNTCSRKYIMLYVYGVCVLRRLARPESAAICAAPLRILTCYNIGPGRGGSRGGGAEMVSRFFFSRGQFHCRLLRSFLPRTCNGHIMTYFEIHLYTLHNPFPTHSAPPSSLLIPHYV